MSAAKPVSNEFRSDTFTTPTQSMLDSVVNASVGDAVYNEDQDTISLEKRIADLCGMEAGLYCVSGTMANQVGIRTHLIAPPYSIICDYRSHIYMNEAAGLAMLSGAIIYPAIASNGKYITLEDIKERFMESDGNIHTAPTKLISLENTIQGVVIPYEELKRIREFCDEKGIGLHCDGARLWNASVASGITFKQYGEIFDSISICMSKGLGAPIGSVLVGKADYIKRANHFRKQVGGGIRQSGLLARMIHIAIDENLPLIEESHRKAKELADFLEAQGIHLLVPTETNFVFIDFKKSPCDPGCILAAGKKYGVNIAGGRFAFHIQTTQESVDICKKAIMEAFEESKKIDSKVVGGIY